MITINQNQIVTDSYRTFNFNLFERFIQQNNDNIVKFVLDDNIIVIGVPIDHLFNLLKLTPDPELKGSYVVAHRVTVLELGVGDVFRVTLRDQEDVKDIEQAQKTVDALEHTLILAKKRLSDLKLGRI